MAIVNMKCPNCRGNMKFKNGQMYCTSCKTILFEVDVPIVNDEISIMSAEEFSANLESHKQAFIIQLDDKFEVVDARTEIINTRLKKAEKALDRKRYEQVPILLSGVPDHIQSAARMRFLASCNVRSEKEFADGYDVKDLAALHHLISICTGTNKETYQKILELHQLRLQERKTRKLAPCQERNDAAELWSLGRRGSAKEIMKRLCQQYPRDIEAWMQYASYTSGNTQRICYINVWKLLSQMTQDEQYETYCNIQKKYKDPWTWKSFSYIIVNRLFVLSPVLPSWEDYANENGICLVLCITGVPLIPMILSVCLDIALLLPRLIKWRYIAHFKQANGIKIFPKTKELLQPMSWCQKFFQTMYESDSD